MISTQRGILSPVHDGRLLKNVYFCTMNIYWYILIALSLSGNILLLVLYFHSRWSYHKLMNKNLKEEEKKNTLVDKFSYENLPMEDVNDKRLFQLLQKCMEEDKAYLNPNLGLQDVAKMVGTSKSKLSHLINTAFQQNFPAYVNHYRIRESIVQLSDSRNFDKNIEEIGELCGYTSRQAFHTAFKKEMGITPRHFRNITRIQEKGE